MFAGFLMKWALELNFNILHPDNTLVHVGWQITRDIANLGFVLAMILIAFAFILRFNEYGSWEAVKNLIISAILVNFSFAIAGLFIDFSNVATSFFLSRATGDGDFAFTNDWPSNNVSGGITNKLAAAFGPQRFYLEAEDPLPPDPAEESGVFTGISTAILVSLSGLVFTIIFTILASLVMLGLALMLLYRYLYLSFLVLMSPIVWLAKIVPEMKSQWSNWWSNFLNWIFFAPAVSFFLYLTLLFIDGLGKTQIPTVGGGGFFASSMSHVLLQGVNMILVVLTLSMGITTAQKMGLAGASEAMKMTEGFKGKLQGMAKDRGARMKNAVVSNTLGGEKGRNFVAGLQRFGANSRLAKYTGVGGLVRAAGRGLGGATKDTDSAVAEARKKDLEGLNLEEKMRKASDLTAAGRVAVLVDVSEEHRKLRKVAKDTEKAKKSAEKKRENATTRKESAEKRRKAAEDVIEVGGLNPQQEAQFKRDMQRAEDDVLSAQESIDAAKEEIEKMDKEVTKAEQKINDFDDKINKNLHETTRNKLTIEGFNPTTETFEAHKIGLAKRYGVEKKEEDKK